MRTGSLLRPLAVVAIPAPLEMSAQFPRATWPAHVTLAGNFLVDAPLTRVSEVTRAACANVEPMTARFEGVELFGRERDIPVQLVRSAQVVSLHNRLAADLEKLASFSPEEPLHWRAGFRAHMTHVAGRETPEGDELLLDHVAIAEIDGAHASVVDVFPLAPSQH